MEFHFSALLVLHDASSRAGVGYNHGMSERDEKRGGAGCAIGLVVAFVLLPLLYVLSVGPAILVAKAIPSAEGFLQVIYWPLLLLHEYEPAKTVLDWYVAFWE
jgi:hypothetical protein